jgi:hypothetical protein
LQQLGLLALNIHSYIQDFNVHKANTTHGTESEVFRGVKKKSTIHCAASKDFDSFCFESCAIKKEKRMIVGHGQAKTSNVGQ